MAHGARLRVVTLRKPAAQLDREISDALKSVDVKKLFAWRPKLEETLADIKEGRLSLSPDLPARVSRLDTPRGAYMILDGHHRIVEAILAKRPSIKIEMDQYVPRIERTGGAYQSYVDDKVNVYDFIQRRR
jgi:hypothetical protein